MYETIVKNNPEQLQTISETDQPLFEFMERLVFDLIPMASDNKSLLDMTKLYIKLLQLNFSETQKLLNKRVLMKYSAEANLKREYFETLIQNMDSTIREVYAHVLAACVNQCFAEGHTELIDEIMNQVFACIPDDLCKNWLKVNHFLWVRLAHC